MNATNLFSHEQQDFIVEMMNIAAGNAATALGQFLGCRVDLKIPALQVSPLPQVASVFDDPSVPAAVARMRTVGDVTGQLLYIVPAEYGRELRDLAERVMGVSKREDPDLDLSAVGEIGNILTGVYLGALHDFCKLNIYHTVPSLAIDTVQSFLDQSLVNVSREDQVVFLIKNEFMAGAKQIRSFFLMVPSSDSSIQVLVESMKAAERMYGLEKG
jgi:chemotaxis protein CheC